MSDQDIGQSDHESQEGKADQRSFGHRFLLSFGSVRVHPQMQMCEVLTPNAILLFASIASNEEASACLTARGEQSTKGGIQGTERDKPDAYHGEPHEQGHGGFSFQETMNNTHLEGERLAVTGGCASA
jgi:hypothetical protein